MEEELKQGVDFCNVQVFRSKTGQKRGTIPTTFEITEGDHIKITNSENKFCVVKIFLDLESTKERRFTIPAKFSVELGSFIKIQKWVVE